MFEFQAMRDLQFACPTPMKETIQGFSRYQRTVESLLWRERKKVDDVANYIFASFRPGCILILSVTLVGHADTDLQKGHPFEHDISVDRAVNVGSYLRKAIDLLSKDFKAAPGRPVPADIQWSHDGAGATDPTVEYQKKNPNALSEPERALNRRVEIILEPRPPNQPSTPWTFDPTDAQKRLQKAVEDGWNRRVLPRPSPAPSPPPTLPDWFWKDLPKLDNKPAWKEWRDRVKDWCEKNHVDPDPIMDTFKDIPQSPGDSPGPIDVDFEKELRRRQALPPPPNPAD